MVLHGRVQHLRPIFSEALEWVRINIRFCAAQGTVLNCAGAKPKGAKRVQSWIEMPVLSFPARNAANSAQVHQLIVEQSEATSRYRRIAGEVQNKKKELGQEWQRVKHW